ncbi:MAG TPA: hypothetical protein VIG64_05215 [Actinomycetota bacterium]
MSVRSPSRALRRIEALLVARREIVTWAAVAVSAFAGAALAVGGLTTHYGWWFLVPPLVLARLALNALDRSLGRAAGKRRSGT